VSATQGGDPAYQDVERVLRAGPKSVGELLRVLPPERAGSVSVCLIGMRSKGLVTLEDKDENDPDKPRRWRLVEPEAAAPTSRRMW
jgi:hypothetical protein